MKRTLGTCYYPEHWPQDIWAQDAAQMVDAGLSYVRIGEFAWGRMEPVEGQFDWAWLDHAIDVLGDAGLHVILGTPTATPPRWVLDKFPDMLAVDAQGQPRKFGSRRHYCFSHQGYRAQCAIIVDAMAKRYGANPHVTAWQTDNEYGCHDTTVSYSDAARLRFQNWLAQKYQSPQALNTAWGNVFWSMEYDSFDQIDLPNLTVTEANHPHQLAFLRFSSDQVVAFNRVQTDILRRYTDAPLIHNYMGRVLDFDHFDVGADLDIASWDSYPIGFLSDRLEATPEYKSKFLRQGDPDMQAFHHDLYRAVGKGRWWIMEQQPGPVNWAPYNPAPLDGMARLWAWEAFAHGAETVCYFRWRQAPFAQEQMHAGLLRPDSQPAPALAECKQVHSEIQTLGDVDAGTSDVALLFDYPSDWAWKVQPQGASFDYFALTFSLYKALRSQGLNVDIVDARTCTLADYKLVLGPGILALPQSILDQLGDYKGVALFGPRTNVKTDELAIPVPMGPNITGLETTVVMTETLPPNTPSRVTDHGNLINFIEHLEGDATTHWHGDHGPAWVSNGAAHYISGWPDPATAQELVRQLCAQAGLATIDLPEELRCRTTSTHRFWFNYGPDAVTHQGQTIPAAGVYWERL